MKLLLTMLALSVLLYGCGGGQDTTIDDTKTPSGMTADDGVQNDTTPNTEADNGFSTDGSNMGSQNDSTGGSLTEDIGNGLDDAGNAIENGVDRAGSAIENGLDDAGNALRDDNNTASNTTP